MVVYYVLYIDAHCSFDHLCNVITIVLRSLMSIVHQIFPVPLWQCLMYADAHRAFNHLCIVTVVYYKHWCLLFTRSCRYCIAGVFRTFDAFSFTQLLRLLCCIKCPNPICITFLMIPRYRMFSSVLFSDFLLFFCLMTSVISFSDIIFILHSFLWDKLRYSNLILVWNFAFILILTHYRHCKFILMAKLVNFNIEYYAWHRLLEYACHR